MPRPLRSYVIPTGGEFGARRAGGRTHAATDYHPLNNADGQPIYGTGPGGVVTHIGYNPDTNLGLGHNITVTYPAHRVTIDGHMQARTPLRLGDKVDQNTILGYVGHTGNAVNASPPGSHDHHQMTINGALVNPETYYSAEPTTKKRKDMLVAEHKTHDANGKVTGVLNYLVGEITLRPLTVQAELEVALLAWGPALPVDDSRLNVFVNTVKDNLAALARKVAEQTPKPPTAAENGAAARAAIITEKV